VTRPLPDGSDGPVHFSVSGLPNGVTGTLTPDPLPGTQSDATLHLNGAPVVCQLRRILNGYRLMHRGVSVDVQVFTRRQAELARLMPPKLTSNSSKRVLCPMPGLVVSVIVSNGQEVKAGEPLAIVEAMKMENILRAERDGKVKAIHVKKGDNLAVDSVIMEFA